MEDFVPSKFKNPDKEHNVIYTWVWNSQVTKKKIDSRLKEYNLAGIKGLYVLALPKNFRPGYMETCLTPEYLSDEYFALLKYAFEKAKSYDMEIWLYDEGGWPSGGACGLTGKQNPKAYETTLVKREISLNKGDNYFLESPCIAVFEGVNRLENSFVALRDMTVTEYLAQKSNENHPSRIDGTNKSAVDTFIGNTYDAFFNYFGDMFGNDLKAIFTDEPALLKNTIPKDLFSVFKTKYGYDLTDYLPFLLDGSIVETNVQAKARIDYARLLGELFYENYCKNIASWCKEHDIKMAGHLDIDHTAHSTDNHAYFSHLHCLSAFDIPGIDVIWEQIRYPYNYRTPVEEGVPFFPRLASSAAHQNGGNLALSESFAVYGDGITPDEMRYILNYQAIRGINIFNFMLTSIDSEKHNAMVERPVFSPEKPGFYNLRHINEYYSRLSYLLKLGKPVIETALYNPCADYWAGDKKRDISASAYSKNGETLEKLHIPFDIIDDYAIMNANVTKKGLEIGDAIYTSVVVPDCSFMPFEVKEKIEPFVKCLTFSPLIKDLDDNLRIMVRKTDRGTLCFIFNQGLDTIKQTVDLPRKNLYKLNVYDGEVYKAENAEIDLCCGDIAVFLVTDEEFDCSSEKPLYSLEIKDFKATYCSRFKLTLNGLKKVSCNLCEVNSDFSGEITYKSNFTLPEEPKIKDRFRLTLTDTTVSAKIFINREAVATIGMTPMTAIINGEHLKMQNEIEIVVSNTAANEIVANHKVFEAFPPETIGGYDEKSIEFEKRRYDIKLGSMIIEKLL